MLYLNRFCHPLSSLSRFAAQLSIISPTSLSSNGFVVSRSIPTLTASIRSSILERPVNAMIKAEFRVPSVCHCAMDKASKLFLILSTLRSLPLSPINSIALFFSLPLDSTNLSRSTESIKNWHGNIYERQMSKPDPLD